MRVPTKSPLTLRIREREFTLSAVDGWFNNNYDWWRGNNLDVRQSLDDGDWMISLSGPWYDDSDPEGRGATLEAAIGEFIIELDRWIKHLSFQIRSET